uniref:Uncharacterized protein n=1 Tax=Aegilops tauschii subsp. strangulata TaxID=200361 RepID=A0A452ZFU6_AEGTS
CLLNQFLLSSTVLLLPPVRPADGRGGSRGECPRDRDAVLRRAPGGRGGAGAAAPLPPSLPRLPRARAHHRRPLHLRRHSPPLTRRRPRRPLLRDQLRGEHRLLRGGRHHQLRVPPPRRRGRGVGLGSRASSGSCPWINSWGTDK